jgi:hypothetical protein
MVKRNDLIQAPETLAAALEQVRVVRGIVELLSFVLTHVISYFATAFVAGLTVPTQLRIDDDAVFLFKPLHPLPLGRRLLAVASRHYVTAQRTDSKLRSFAPHTQTTDPPPLP